MDGGAPVKKLTPTQKLEKRIKELEEKNTELNEKRVKEAKQLGIEFDKVSVAIEYEIDNLRKIKLGLNAKLNGLSPEEGHSKLYLELLSSLQDIIDMTVGDSEIKEE